MRSLLFLFVWLCSVSVAVAQTTLTGRVTDASTGQPLPFATVYIEGTTRGTLTNEQGEYRLTGVSLGSVELAASYVGYRPVKRSLRLTDGIGRRVPLLLQPDAAQLQAVTVTAQKPRAWQRQFRQFKAALLGESAFANQCEITNGREVEFSEKDGHLRATAPEALVIENRALGYRLHYQLLHFDFHRGATYYAGLSRFEELTPDSPTQAARWRRARQRAYEGSTHHLLASLLTGTHEREGFLVHQAKFALPEDAQRVLLRTDQELGPRLVHPDSLFRPGELPFERELVLTSCLEIFNTRLRSRNSPYPELPYAYTVLYLPQGRALVTTDGWVVNPQGMEMRGYLGGDRLATLLPADWRPEGAAIPPTVLAQAPGTPPPAPDARLDSLAVRETPPPGDPLVFVHPDKPLYTTGDRLWLSAWLLDPATHQPLADRPGPNGTLRNPALHLELLTPAGQRVLHQAQPVSEGRAAGDFRLSDSLSTGAYRLRAYSNAPGDTLQPAFERVVFVQSGLKAPSFDLPAVGTDLLDVQLLPEGGRWVAGLTARLGVKVLARRGQGQYVNLTVFDGQNREVTRLTTNALGMGSVQLTPAPGQVYRAEARWGVFSQKIVLPPVEPEGLTLSADAVSDSSRIRLVVRASAGYGEQPVYLLAQSRGRVQGKLKLTLKDGLAQGEIRATTLPPGVCQLTLFDATGQPRAERLVFVPEPMLPPTMAVTPGKPRYEAREWAAFALRLLDGDEQPLAITGSVSVTDADQVAADSTAADLRAHLLLTSALRGRVENPGFYFRKNTPTTRRALDDLLLTQGWRRFAAQPAEADSLGGLALRGRVLDRRGRPVAGASLLLTSTDAAQPIGFSARTDAEGWFRANGLTFRDTLRLRPRVMDEAFKPLTATVRLEAVERTFSEKWAVVPDWIPTPKTWETARQHQETDLAAYRERDARQLAGVVVRGRKLANDFEARPNSLHGMPDAAMNIDENAAQFGTVFDMITGRLPGVQVTRAPSGIGYSVIIRGIGALSGSSGPLYLLDGVYTDQEQLMSINPRDIERVELVKNSGAAIYGARGGSGVLAFYSRKEYKKNHPASDANDLTAYGFPTQREFYVPRYGEMGGEAPQSDQRDVLFWNPRLTTNDQGSTTIRFPLSDVVRTLRIVVQGVTAEGEPVVVERLVPVR